MKFSKLKVRIFFPLFCRGGNWEQKSVFFFHFSCFTWYWLHIWSILKSNTSFEILKTLAFRWIYSISLYVRFYVCLEAFYVFFCVVFGHFGIWDNNFETFINPMIFHQIRLPRIVLNAELNELSKSAIDFNFWWRSDADITIRSHRAK